MISQNHMLIAHISVAIMIGVMALLSLFAIIGRHKQYYSPLAIAIGMSSFVQLVTGSVLAVNANGTLLEFCSQISLYIATIIAVEAALIMAMRKEKAPFPMRYVASPISLGVLFSIASGIIIYTN